MKSVLSIIALLPLLLFTACGDDGKPQSQIDRERIQEYLADNNLEALEHPTGIFYNITREGNGEFPNPRSKVVVTYKGYFLDGEVFDETEAGERLEIELTRLIPGWQIAIPLLSKGGAGTFYIPSRLGYGPAGSGSIPPNTVLVFEIELIDFV